MGRQPESRLVGRIKEYIAKKGGRSVKIHGGDNYQEIGIADLLVCYHGYFIAIECKMPGEQLSPKQRLFLDSIEKAGGYTIVAYSVNDVVELFADIDRKR